MSVWGQSVNVQIKSLETRLIEDSERADQQRIEVCRFRMSIQWDSNDVRDTLTRYDNLKN